jgi:hypothetical protein
MTIRSLLSRRTPLLFICASAVASTVTHEQLSVIKALKIDSGTITQVQHDDSPVFTADDGKTQTNLPPRTIVKLVLTPASGSNINVELWLPDPEKWNARFLGIGNGGSAGHINPMSLARPAAGGYAVRHDRHGHRPQRRLRHRQSRGLERLRLSRHPPHDGRRQTDHHRLLRKSP